jgi:hypothetical protein
MKIKKMFCPQKKSPLIQQMCLTMLCDSLDGSVLRGHEIGGIEMRGVDRLLWELDLEPLDPPGCFADVEMGEVGSHTCE